MPAIIPVIAMTLKNIIVFDLSTERMLCLIFQVQQLLTRFLNKVSLYWIHVQFVDVDVDGCVNDPFDIFCGLCNIH